MQGGGKRRGMLSPTRLCQWLGPYHAAHFCNTTRRLYCSETPKGIFPPVPPCQYRVTTVVFFLLCVQATSKLEHELLFNKVLIPFVESQRKICKRMGVQNTSCCISMDREHAQIDAMESMGSLATDEWLNRLDAIVSTHHSRAHNIKNLPHLAVSRRCATPVALRRAKTPSTTSIRPTRKPKSHAKTCFKRSKIMS